MTPDQVLGVGMGATALSLAALTKDFGGGRGVFGLSLALPEGQVLGFLGPNGAGKTTTIRLMLDYLRPDAGSAGALGLDCHRDAVALRRRIGYLPAEYRLYEDMTGEALLRYLASFRPAGSLERAHMLAERLGIALEGRVKLFSKGMKQKVALIQALMHDPELLILDEPTDGLDPLIQQEVRQILLDCRARGRSVFFSSHVLSEVEHLCDRVAIIREGRLLAIDDVESLRRKRVRLLTLTFDRDLDARTLDVPRAVLRAQHGRQATFAYAGAARELLTVLASLPIADFTLEAPRLDEAFLEYYL